MLTDAERIRGVVVRISQGYDSTKYNETVPKIPENGIVKFEFLPEAEANNYKVMVSVLFLILNPHRGSGILCALR